MKNLHAIEALADLIEKEYLELHSESKNWSKVFGQFLVYGFERQLGFFKAAELCAEIERAHKCRKNIKKAAYEFFVSLP